MRLLEHQSKAWLRSRGLPVPEGFVASQADQVAVAVNRLGGPVVVKALVPAGRRGKAGAVRFAANAEEAARAASEILKTTVGGYRVDEVYVERRIEIRRELYLSFAFGSIAPKIVLSKAGGVDIEETFEHAPTDVVDVSLDPRREMKPWDAAALWRRAGIGGSLLPPLMQLTARLAAAFRDADALMLEINPLAVDPAGNIHLVGTMMEVDDNALFRHGEWLDLPAAQSVADKPPNERERAIVDADRRLPGGAIRYTELDGDIGLLVAGGGAGLLQHDMIVDLGGRPANHTDVSPTPTPEKPEDVFDAIFSNPRTRGLLIGYNYLQMAPCDRVAEALLSSARKHKIDTAKFPIVVRLFGPAEERARELVASLPGVNYLPSGAPLADGVRAIVKAINELPACEVAQ